MRTLFRFLVFIIILEFSSLVVVKTFNTYFQHGKTSDFKFTETQKQKIIQFLDDGLHYRCFDSALGWVNKPRANVSIESGKRNINVNINADGFRSTRRYEKKKDANVTRILTLGDSFTFGSEVDDSECWSSILECKDSNFEVLNAGVPGFGLDQSLLYFKRLNEDWNPDVVIVSYMTMLWLRHLNTFQPFRSKRSIPLSKPRFLVENGKLNLLDNYLNSPQKYESFLEKPNAFLKQLGRNDYFYSSEFGSSSPEYGNFVKLLYLLMGDQTKEKAELYTNGYYNQEHEGYSLTIAILDEFVNAIRKINAKPIILFFPTKQDIEKMQQIKDSTYRVYRPLYKELSAKGVQCFDFAEDFYDLDTSILFENKGHYSPFGNEIIANKLFDIINQIK